MSSADCPSHDELWAYMVGRVGEDAVEAVSVHVDACPDCRLTLGDIEDAEDTLVAQLRQPADDPYREESQCRQLVLELEAVAGESADPADTPLEPGHLGEYELLEELGRGAMGTVFKALHTKLGRTVALKVLPKGRTANRRAVARFEREMKIVGALDHPNIVRAYDAREVDGTRMLVMEYIQGLNLSELVRRAGPLPIAGACELIRQAAVGLQCAYENGLVHRDVKPSNLMLTADGQVKVLDMGLARIAEGGPAGEEMTDSGQAMGTADYMAPEQASDSHTADIRADVYSLGCTLYKLLTGQAPFGDPKYRSTFEKMTAHVRESVPPIRSLRSDLPEELEKLIDRMLAKVPSARFSTPEEVVEAIAPFTAGCDLPGLLREAEQRSISPAKAKKRPAAADAPHDSARGRTQAAQRPERPSTPLPIGRRRKLLAVAVGLMLLVVGTGLAFQIVVRIKNKDGTERVITVPEGSDFTITPSKQGEKPGVGKPSTSAPTLLATLRHTDNVTFVAFSHDGKMLATASHDRTVMLWDTKTLARLAVLGGHPGQVTRVAFSPDGKVLATGTPNGIVSLWDRRGREPIATLKAHVQRLPAAPAWAAISLAFLPDGNTLVSGGQDGTVKLWDVQTHQLRATFKGHSGPIQDIALTPDGKLLASASYDRTAKLWDVSTGELQATLVGHPAGLKDLAFSPDGKTLASSDDRGTCILWDAETGQRRATLEGHRDRVPSLAFSPDGKTLASASFDKTIKLWDVETGRERATLKGHIHWVRRVVFSPDGTILASGGGEWPPGDKPRGEVRLWDPRTGRELAILAGHTEQVWRVAFSPDGTKLVSSGSDDVARVWDLRGLEVDSPPADKAKPNGNESGR